MTNRWVLSQSDVICKMSTLHVQSIEYFSKIVSFLPIDRVRFTIIVFINSKPQAIILELMTEEYLNHLLVSVHRWICIEHFYTLDRFIKIGGKSEFECTQLRKRAWMKCEMIHDWDQ